MDEINSIDDIVHLAQQGFTDWKQFGYVTVRPKGDLLIFNYNAMAQYSEEWTYFERVSRGLIINYKTGEIVARAFDKFFNWGQGEHTTKTDIVTVMEKMDGSLGVLYRTDAGYHIATRGSFDGDQAEWATAFLNDKYDLTGLPVELTLLFEIIYPDNRIVVDYGDRKDLVLLAARNRFTGDYAPFARVCELAEQYGFSIPKVYEFSNVDVLIKEAQTLDVNNEGFVAEFADGQRFKFKSLEYLKLHKLIVTLTFKNVLKAMQSNSIEQILEVVPDEFLGETRQWIGEIETTIESIKEEVQKIFAVAPKSSRKDFALWVQANHKNIRQYLFAMMDGKDIEPLIYRSHDWGHDAEDEE